MLNLKGVRHHVEHRDRICAASGVSVLLAIALALMLPGVAFAQSAAPAPPPGRAQLPPNTAFEHAQGKCYAA
jgi:hypothetical protein